MNAKLARIITFFIPIKTQRKKLRSFLEKVDILASIVSILSTIKIMISKTKNSDIALVEINPFHAECLFSIYKYLLKEKRNVTIFTTKENIDLNLFVNEDIEIICIDSISIKILDTFKYFNRFNYIFANSYFVWSTKKSVEYFFKNFLINKKILTVDHAPGHFLKINSDNKNIIKFVLADFMSEKFNFPVIYTCIFPKTEHTQKDLKKSILSVGGIGDNSRRDIDSLFNYLKEHNDVSAYFIGQCINEQYKQKLSSLNNIENLGRTNFDDLFKYCIKSHFIAFLIHGKNLTYYKNAISGNLNLVLAFSLIPIIDKEIAALYNITDKEGILYDGEAEF